MAAVRKSLGTVPCLCCKEAVPVKESEAGAISVSCPWCDLSAYAKRGTQAHGLIMARMQPAAAEVQPNTATSPAPVADPKPAPAAKPARSTVFG